MNRLKYVLSARAEVDNPIKQYEIDWNRILIQVREAAELVKNKEPEMKKKNGRKKKGY